MLDFYEIGVPIDGFPNYEVTNHGRVFNTHTGRCLALSPTLPDRQGDLSVGLIRDGIQHRHSVKVLVAKTFVDGRSETFNTPILLDGNRFNLHYENIVWRPRWFAWKYTRQFKTMESWFFEGPIVDINTGHKYQDIFEASTTNGLLCEDVRRSLYTGRQALPTRQIFGEYI